ncbi:HAD family phosphatase [bacterium]|nr:HAD family phosphatase [candidate division CSSED10-310 bacterium]
MKKLLICFDVDGTLIDDTIFIWQTLHDAIGTDPTERDRWSKAFWNKEISYAEWAGKDIAMWRDKGVTRQEILRHLRLLRPMDGAWECLKELHRDGHILGVISGSLDIALEQAFPRWEWVFSHVFLNRLVFDENQVLKGVVATPYDIDHKADGLREMAHRTGISLNDTVFIGDHFNDVAVARLAGRSIAFNCKSDELEKVSDVTTTGTDLRVILPVIREFALNDHTALNSVIS